MIIIEIAQAIGRRHPGLTVRVWCSTLYLLRVQVDELNVELVIDLRRMPVRDCCFVHQVTDQASQSRAVCQILWRHDLIHEDRHTRLDT